MAFFYMLAHIYVANPPCLPQLATSPCNIHGALDQAPHHVGKGIKSHGRVTLFIVKSSRPPASRAGYLIDLPTSRKVTLIQVSFLEIPITMLKPETSANTLCLFTATPSPWHGRRRMSAQPSSGKDLAIFTEFLETQQSHRRGISWFMSGTEVRDCYDIS
jgi:hypothetical protein